MILAVGYCEISLGMGSERFFLPTQYIAWWIGRLITNQPRDMLVPSKACFLQPKTLLSRPRPSTVDGCIHERTLRFARICISESRD